MTTYTAAAPKTHWEAQNTMLCSVNDTAKGVDYFNTTKQVIFNAAQKWS